MSSLIEDRWWSEVARANGNTVKRRPMGRAEKSEIRKIANQFARDVRLGHIGGTVEVERGTCDDCSSTQMRRFQAIYRESHPRGPASHYIVRGRELRCVRCYVRAMR